jgi:Fur family zinc uptake transcriptional regulator
MKERVLTPFKKPSHNHTRCVRNAMAEAEQTCVKAGLRLTKTRRTVLKLVWNSHAPIKAYDILQEIHKDNPKAAPPTVYRALDFLIEAGLVHKLESLNAYIGCGDPSRPHIGQFLICTGCGAVAELDEPKITRMLIRQTKELGFQIKQQVVEIQGQCPECAQR